MTKARDLANFVSTGSPLADGTVAVADISDLTASAAELNQLDTNTFTNPLSLPDGTASLPALTNTGDTNTGVFFPAADTVAIATNGVERMRVAPGTFGGYLGIGTTAPSAPLNVSLFGTSNVPVSSFALARIEQGPTGSSETTLQIAARDQSGGGAAIHFGVGALANSTRIVSLGSTDGLIIQENSGGPIRFSTSGVFDSVYITNAGNVGIGTTSPSTPLHVVGASTLASVNVSDSVTTTADNDGTFSSGTYTPTPVGGNMKRIVNGGAFTFAAPTAAGDYTLIVQMTNTTGAGAVTFSGFNKTAGAALTTTNGDDFLFTIVKINGFTYLNTATLQ